MPNGYWNAHSDLDWLAQTGVEDKLPCEICESSTGNFCIVCGFEEGEKCPYEDRRGQFDESEDAVAAFCAPSEAEMLEVHARCWDKVMFVLFGDEK